MNSLGAEKWISVSMYSSYFFVMMVVISVITLMLSTLKNKTTLCMTLSIFLVGILDTLLMGFSPTVYASDVRTDYVFMVCCVLSCISVIHYFSLLRNNKTQQTIKTI